MQINGIDKFDEQIIELLEHQGRLSYSEIGSKIGLSRTSVKNRMTSLEKRGIIAGYKAIINPLDTTEMTYFVLNVETKPEAFEVVREAFTRAEETVLLIQTTGKCRLSGICASENMKTMRQFVNGMYKISDGIVHISANSIMDFVKGTIVP